MVVPGASPTRGQYQKGPGVSYKLNMLGAGLPGVIPQTGINPLVQGVHRPEPAVSPLRCGILSDLLRRSHGDVARMVEACAAASSSYLFIFVKKLVFLFGLAWSGPVWRGLMRV